MRERAEAPVSSAALHERSAGQTANHCCCGDPSEPSREAQCSRKEQKEYLGMRGGHAVCNIHTSDEQQTGARTEDIEDDAEIHFEVAVSCLL